MLATDIRNQGHAAKRAGHAENRAAVLAALVEAPAPLSTRALAERMGWDLLAVRPRVTELYQGGLVILAGRGPDGGLYRAATFAEVQAFRERYAAAADTAQTNLPLRAAASSDS